LGLNLRDALAGVSRAFADFLVHAGAFVGCGFVALVEFAALLVVARGAGLKGPAAVPLLAALVVLAGALTLAAWERLFFRRKAAMLFAFAGRDAGPIGREARELFPDAAGWSRAARRLRQALVALRRAGETGPIRPGIPGLAAETAFCRAVLTLAISRGSGDLGQRLPAALALYWRHGVETRRMAERWLRFSASAQGLLFAVLALANVLIFRQAGAPATVGVALAVAVAWPLHRAFFAPLALAGVSAALIAETRGREPDEDLSRRIASLLIR
jgi:hypothetical protein